MSFLILGINYHLFNLTHVKSHFRRSREYIMEKFVTKEKIVAVAIIFWLLVQSNYFATKLDLANVKLEMAQMKIELKKYADDGDRELLHNIDSKYQIILSKLDKINR